MFWNRKKKVVVLDGLSVGELQELLLEERDIHLTEDQVLEVLDHHKVREEKPSPQDKGSDPLSGGMRSPGGEFSQASVYGGPIRSREDFLRVCDGLLKIRQEPEKPERPEPFRD